MTQDEVFHVAGVRLGTNERSGVMIVPLRMFCL